MLSNQVWMDRFTLIVDVERSHDEKALDAKIERCNGRAALEHDPWSKFRASLSLGRGLRSVRP